jgi:hypothetical protein
MSRFLEENMPCYLTGKKGPYEVLLTTYTAIKMKENSSWIHTCNAKIAPGHESQDN